MNRLHLTKRTKIIIGFSAIAFVGLTSFGLTNNLTNFNYFTTQNIVYSTSAPSTIEKNSVNDRNFTSPVANVKFVPKPPEKITPPSKKVETPKVDQINVVPQKPKEPKKVVQPPKAQILTPEKPKLESKPVEIPIPSPIVSNKNDVTPIEKPKTSNNDIQVEVTTELEKRALANYQKGFEAEIKKVEQRIENAQQAYDNKVYVRDNKWNDYSPMWNRNKLSEYEWKAELAGQVSLAKYDLDKETSYLNWLKSQPKKTSFTQDEIKSLSRGLIPSETDLGVWRYDNPDDNPETGKNGRLRINNRKRVFNTQSWYSQTPYDILHGNFSGWDKKDVTSQYSSYLQGHENSIKIYRYTPNAQNEDQTRKPGDIIELDANDNQAFQKFQAILADVNQHDQELKGVRLKNVGENHSTQNAEDILKSIPDSIKAVYLFVDNYEGTDSLKGLRDKHLDELAIYTNKNSLDADWSVSPNDLQNVKFISFDYNNQAQFGQYQGKIAGSIVFNTLRWYAGDDTNTIKKGLEIAFGSKMEQRPFQGSFGGKGGHPTALDFSLTNQNTFNGLDMEHIQQLFNQSVKNWTTDKYAKEDYEHHTLSFTKLIVGVNEDGVINFKADDLNNAGFTRWIQPGGPQNPPIIAVKNRDTYELTYDSTIRVTGNLTTEGANQLKRFLEIANSSSSGNKIQNVTVDNWPSGMSKQIVVPSSSTITNIIVNS